MTFKGGVHDSGCKENFDLNKEPADANDDDVIEEFTKVGGHDAAHEDKISPSWLVKETRKKDDCF